MKISRSVSCAAAAWLALATAPLAHPHIFVDTGFVLRLDDQQQLVGIEVIWTYDEFYSLLIFEDLALDADYDGALTVEEMDKLRGFDMNWDAGYAGDTYVRLGDSDLELGAPDHLDTTVADGLIATRHLRMLAQPVPVQDVVIRAYDPTYYTAYRLSQGVVAEGCRVEVTPPDLNRAYSLVEELLYAMPTEQAEDSYPEVGAAFADEVRVLCAS